MSASAETLAGALRVPGVLAPVYITVVATTRPPVVITFLLADQFRTLRLIRIKDLQ